MRNVFIVLVLIVFFLVGAIVYHGRELERQESTRQKEKETAAVAAAAAPKQNFSQITALLQADMVKAAGPLTAAPRSPANAFLLKDRVSGLQHIQEYQVVNRVCDLLIYADQEHGVRQREYQMALSRTGAGALETGAADARVQAERDAIKSRAEASWNEYIGKTRTEIQRLLATLQNKSL